MVPIKWQGKLSILFEPCHHLRTYCSFLLCYKLATNILVCCPISDKLILSVVSACLIADYLYPNFFVKAVCISLVSFSLIHFHKSSPTLLHGIYFLVFRMPNKWKQPETNMQHVLAYTFGYKSCSIMHFCIFECHHFCLTRFGLVFMIFFWTSSQFLIHIGECRLSYCIDKNFSNSLQLFIVLFECWALTMTSKKVSSVVHAHHVIIVTELLEHQLIQSLLLTHHCYSLPCVYILTFTTVITSQHGLRLITVKGIWICIVLSCIFLHWICVQIA